ncbi:DNA helicase, partial [bacterium]|nr:DNA helicase [bacterium]
LLRIPEGAAPEVGRIAARFALVSFAGELATHLGVTGWKGGDAHNAAVRCFNDWLVESGGELGADDKALFAQVSAFLQANGPSRFPPHNISEEDLRRVFNLAGFSF